MPRRRTLAALALLALPVVAAVACSADPYAPKALYSVNADTLHVRSLNGTGAEAESGIRLLTASNVVPDYTEGFDFALDIDSLGRVVLIPRTKILTCTVICQLGIKIVPTDSVPFDSLFDAPKAGYTYDSVTVLPVGATVAFVTKEIFCQPSNISTFDLYAKMIVDSVRPADRSIFVRVVSDPNCGFRGLVPATVPGH
jgi:hypothetical protein